MRCRRCRGRGRFGRPRWWQRWHGLRDGSLSNDQEKDGCDSSEQHDFLRAPGDQLEAKLKGCGLCEAALKPHISSMIQDLHPKEPHPTAAGQTALPGITLSDTDREALTGAPQQIAGRGVVDESSSAIVRLLAQIGSRFGVVVSQKVAAQAVPVIGAVGGAAVNAAFMDHFLTLARAHFTVRRLEREFGAAPVRAIYDEIRAAQRA